MDNTEIRESGNNEPRFFYGYIVVLASLLIVLMILSARTSFGVFFKPILSEYHWNRASISGAVTLSLISQGLWGMVMGRVNDKVGPRVVITLCCFLAGLGFLLMARMDNLWEIYVYYGVFIGFAVGGVFVALLSTVSRWFVKRKGVMTGIVLTGIGVSMLTLTPLANWLISVFDWRLAYAIMGGLVLVIGIPLAQFLRRDPGSMGLLPYGQQDTKGDMPAENAKGLSFNEALRTWQFWSLLLIILCFGYLMFTVMTHYIPHMTDLDVTATMAANVLAVMGGASIIGGVMLGMTSDRIGPRRVLAICFILMAASFIILIVYGDLRIFYISAIVFGLGSGGAGVTEATVTAELFGMKSYGSVFGAVSFAFTIGGAIGPLITGHIFDASGSYQTAFVLCVIIGTVGFILTAMLRPCKR